MAMVAAASKPMTMLPLSSQTHRNHWRALNTRQRIKSGFYLRNERAFITSFNAHHHKTINAIHVCTRAFPEEDADREKCNKECADEKANIDAPLCEEKTETKGLTSPEPVKKEQEQELQQCCVEKVKPTPTRGRFHYFSKLGFCKTTTTTSTDGESKHQDLQHDSTQDLRCRLRSWWQHATRPQNLLAAFLTGLLLYAFALFGWQVMVVAVDITLFVLKCSFVAVVLLFMYILLI